MLYKGMSKSEIETVLADKGDFVKIDYLTKFLKEEISLDMKKFVYLKLVEIYEKKNLLTETAKTYSNLAEVAIVFSEKINFHIKEAETYIKAGLFEVADRAVKKAIHYANSMQKPEISLEIKEFYKKQAKILENQNRRRHAVKIYEKLVEMNLSDEEKFYVREKLLELYEKLGMISELNLLKGV